MRMRGKEVFYPVGWDDNGLPTERRVQNYYGVRCDPTLPYQPDLQLPGSPAPPASSSGKASRRAAASPADQLPVSRRNFVELCRELTAADEDAYAKAWQRLGLSVDWDISYRTIDERAQAISQRVFLRDLARGDAYQAEGPALWDVTFGTAVAQAETEDREISGSFVRLAFRLAEAGPPRETGPADPGGAPGSDAMPAEVVVATTRPELLPACVALVAHPDDERYAPLFGTHAVTPVFGVTVPVLPHRLADPAKGTGIAMVCTFGDTTDVTWWRDLRLETRPVIGRDGRLLAAPPSWLTGDGLAAYGQIARQPSRAARRRATELLGEAGALRGAPEPVRHAVKFYEKGDSPLEIVTTRQWYIRNGSRDEGLRDRLRKRGRELAWHPAHMRSRFENWVDGLAGDWLVSRQRFSGVPVPVWYPVDADGSPDWASPIVPADADLPADPAAEVPAGYRADQRDLPGGFTADPDVMDTWATSSLTPQIAAGWSTGDDIFSQVFPMDLRPQAHEIIRTWLFYTVLRAQTGEGVLPWRHAAISGWIVDPDRKKMSKSAGNVMTAEDMLADYGTDAVRYWAASARLGVDTVFDPAQLKIGRRLAVKILNASRFVLGIAPPEPAGATAESSLAASEPAPGGPVPGGPDPGGSDAGGSDPGGPDPGAPAASGRITEPLDQALLRALAGVAGQCTAAFESYDHALALEQAERFFWFFCDDYLELVKPRAYGEHGPAAAASASAALREALSVLLRLLAPFLPFVTEEVWSWWQAGSVHRSAWPDPVGLLALAGTPGSTPGSGAAASGNAASGTVSSDRAASGTATSGTAVLDAAAAAIAAVRRAKSQARLPMKAPVTRLIVTAPQDRLDALAAAARDVSSAGRVGEITLHALPGIEPVHEVLLQAPDVTPPG
jgi:valyl-tRNA synthetase